MEKKVIDLSHWEEVKDWNKVKAAVDGVILKATQSTEFVDKKFKEYADACTRHGIPFGVYCYSTARNEAQGKAEAEYLLKQIVGYKLGYPVFFDSEQAGTQGGCKVAAIAFCERIELAGYWAGIYASESWFNSYLNDVTRFTKWVAKYGVNDGKPHTKPSVSGIMSIWQYTDKGKIDGIVGDVDLNIQYRDLGGGPSGTKAAAPAASGNVIDEYVKSRTGKSIDVDKAYSVQCVDAYKDFCNYTGVGAYPTGGPKGSGSAYHYWLNRNDVVKTKDNFSFITDHKQLQNGDWVMWPKSASLPWGHIAMYYNGKAFGQNQSGKNDGFTLQSWDFSKMCGAFRWKKLAGGSTPAPAKKTNDQIAQEVIDGKWGNGEDRKNRIKAAGYDYDAIQKIVNAKATKKSNEQIAQEVIDGKWGNGEDRKKKLTAAGYDYEAIRKIVNAKYK